MTLILNFQEKRQELLTLIKSKHFETGNDVHKLILLYALQINELSCGLASLEKPVTNDGFVSLQSQWVLLRAMFEATIKLRYLCCDSNKTQERFNELECSGVRDQLNSMKTMHAAFPNEENAVEAINLVEAKFVALECTKVSKMEDRMKAICATDRNAVSPEQFNIFWQRSCAVSHSRPSELEMMFTDGNGGFNLYATINSGSINYIYEMAFHFVRMTCECLNDLPNKNN
jgi:hypothetical protein